MTEKNPIGYDPQQDLSWTAVVKRTLREWKWALFTPVVLWIVVALSVHGGVLIHIHVTSIPFFERREFVHAASWKYALSVIMNGIALYLSVGVIRSWKRD